MVVGEIDAGRTGKETPQGDEINGRGVGELAGVGLAAGSAVGDGSGVESWGVGEGSAAAAA
ncbi:MAG: hypothetical protein Fur0021_03390 [Candidatus Promineifilaceae bacterium]